MLAAVRLPLLCLQKELRLLSTPGVAPSTPPQATRPADALVLSLHPPEGPCQLPSTYVRNSAHPHHPHHSRPLPATARLPPVAPGRFMPCLLTTSTPMPARTLQATVFSAVRFPPVASPGGAHATHNHTHSHPHLPSQPFSDAALHRHSHAHPPCLSRPRLPPDNKASLHPYNAAARLESVVSPGGGMPRLLATGTPISIQTSTGTSYNSATHVCLITSKCYQQL